MLVKKIARVDKFKRLAALANIIFLESILEEYIEIVHVLICEEQ